MKCWVGLFLALVACLTQAAVCLADIDDVQLRLLDQFKQPLRWDNVTGCPEWVGGTKPYYSRVHGMHVVRLEPGHSVIVKVRSHEMVRVLNPNGPLTVGSLELALSQGTEMYAAVIPAISSDGKSAVVLPEAADPMLCRVAVPPSAPCGLEVALFISRRDVLGEIAPYRGVICLPGARVKVERSDKGGWEKFWPLMPNHPVDVTVSGPCRIAVESRLVEPPQDTRLHEYRIQALLNDIELATIEADTAPENTKVISISGQSQVVGRLHRGFLEIPPGVHRLTLVPNAAIIGRLLRQETPDYLCPRSNQPPITAEQIRQRGFLSMLFRPSWSLSDGEIGYLGAFPFFSPSANEKAADRLRRDNSRRQGGLMARDLMELAGKSRPDAPEVRERAKELEGYYTGFRNLMPVNKPLTDPQLYWWFVDRKLKKIDQPDLVVAERHTNSYLNMLSGGYFISVPRLSGSPAQCPAPGRPPGQALHYAVPKRSGPAVLRVAVEPSATPQDLVVMLVRGPTHRFQVIPGAEASPSDFRLNLGEAGLEMLRRQRPWLDFSTLGGPFSVRFAPAPLKETPLYEVPLPPQVTEIFVWTSGNAPCLPRVCLQYRDGNPFAMAEQDYLEAEKLLLASQTPYRQFVRLLKSRVDQPAEPISPGQGHLMLNALAGKDLDSFWFPLVRLIRSHYVTFVTPVEESTKHLFTNAGRRKDLSSSEARNLQDQAARMERDGQWIVALEKWGALYYGTTGTAQERAGLKMAETLETLGEDYLAEMLLRRMYLQPEGRRNPELSREALKRLQSIYTRNYAQNNDPGGLLTLACVEVVKNHNPAGIRALVRWLVEAGHYELALMAGMVLPRSERPVREVLRASKKLGWYLVYGQAVSQIPQPAERSMWAGLELIDRGRFKDGQVSLAASGPEGQRQATTVKAAMDIQRHLASPTLEDRIKGILHWERWQWHHPGPFMWNDDPDIISDYAGSASTYSIPRDLHFKAYRATSFRPVKTRIYGPVRVQILARPLHPAHSKQPLTGWMYAKKGPELSITPITNNLPSQGLSLVGEKSWCPGDEVLAVYELGPGLHEMEIHGGEIPLLVRVQTQRPEMPSGILPPLTTETVDAALRGPLAPVPSRESKRLECLGESSLAVLPLARENRPVYRRAELVKASVTGARLSPVTDPSSWRALEEARKQDSWWPDAQSDPLRRQARALSEGDFDKAVGLSKDRTPQDIVNHMALLVYWGEQRPRNLARVEAQAQNLFAKHRDVAFLRGLLTRLSQKTSWEPVTVLEACAGLRILPMHGWNPESDAMRVRKAIDEPLQPGERVVIGQDRLVLVMQNLKPSDVTARLVLADVPFLPPEPLVVSVQLDDGKSESFTLRKDRPSKEITVRVPEGRHRLQVGIVDRYANQFVRVKFCETPSAGECVNVVLTKGDERTYYLATVKDPLRAKILGPAWIRIDELRNEETRVDYRFFPDGWHELALRPESDRKEGLFRIFRRVLSPNPDEVTIPRPVELHFAAVPEPLFRIGSPWPVPVVDLRDEYALGGQQEGTWSLTEMYRDPRAIEESVAEPKANVQGPGLGSKKKDSECDFLELSTSYRYFSEYVPSYSKVTLLSRFREKGGPTTGLLGDWFYYPRNFPCRFGLEGSLYVQRPEAGTFGTQGGPTEYSARIAASLAQRCELTPKAYHTPSLSVFQRIMSMQENKRYAVAGLDQDVFTLYKAQHQAGIIVSDYLGFEPWLDTLWFLRASATTNESLCPHTFDNVGLHTGWKQMLGPFQAEVGYRYSHYFADSDRPYPQDRNFLEFGLRLDKWTVWQHRLQIQFLAERDLDKAEYSGFLSLTWFMGQGRGLRDFRPGEEDFRIIRDRQVPQVVNNRIAPVLGTPNPPEAKR
jgi:hypothetical protein